MFYDGGNDLNKQKDRNQEGRGTDESEVSFAENEINDVLLNGPFVWGLERPPATSVPGTDQVSPTQVARHAMNRYRRGIDLGSRFAEVVGVTPIFIWQPLVPSAPPSAANPDAVVQEDLTFWAEMMPAALEQLPDEVINLADALDNVDRPVFKDLWHTNEYGAEVARRPSSNASDQIYWTPDRAERLRGPRTAAAGVPLASRESRDTSSNTSSTEMCCMQMLLMQRRLRSL